MKKYIPFFMLILLTVGACKQKYQLAPSGSSAMTPTQLLVETSSPWPVMGRRVIRVMAVRRYPLNWISLPEWRLILLGTFILPMTINNRIRKS